MFPKLDERYQFTDSRSSATLEVNETREEGAKCVPKHLGALLTVAEEPASQGEGGKGVQREGRDSSFVPAGARNSPSHKPAVGPSAHREGRPTKA